MRRFLFFALCTTLVCVFVNYDIEAERNKERARIEALMRSSDYQHAYARQLEAWR